jgi:hypothetical protein
MRPPIGANRGLVVIPVLLVAPEFLEGSRKYVEPKQWEGFEKGVTALYKQQGRITIVPDWAKLLDFETRIPRAQEELVAQAAGHS